MVLYKRLTFEVVNFRGQLVFVQVQLVLGDANAIEVYVDAFFASLEIVPENSGPACGLL